GNRSPGVKDTMTLDHLGDALDHWKGSTIERTQAALVDVHVVPMFTDLVQPGDPWNTETLSLYASLLRRPLETILLGDRRFDDFSRAAYFGDDRLVGDFDVFLDPDTGIEP